MFYVNCFLQLCVILNLRIGLIIKPVLKKQCLNIIFSMNDLTIFKDWCIIVFLKSQRLPRQLASAIDFDVTSFLKTCIGCRVCALFNPSRYQIMNTNT